MAAKWEQIPLYDGKVQLFYNDAVHQYRIQNGSGKKSVVVGASSAAKAWSDNAAIAGWRINNVKAFYTDNIQAKIEAGEPVTSVDIKLWADQVHKISWGTGTEMVIGTLTHDWIAKCAKGEEPELPDHPNVALAAKAFVKWAYEVDLRPIHVERCIFSKEHQFAGRLDMEALVNGNRSIVDIKVSNGIYRDMILQTAAYALARNEEMAFTREDEIIRDRYIIRCDRATGEAEVYHSPASEYDADVEIFLAALTIHRDRVKEKTTNREPFELSLP